MYLLKVSKPRKEPEFCEFFDKNWQLRHYSKEFGKATDEIMRKSLKNDMFFKQS